VPTIAAHAPLLTPAQWRADLLLAFVLGVEMQIELSFADAPAGDVLIGRVLLAAITAAVALRRSRTLVAVVLAIGPICGLELIDPAVSENLVTLFFAELLVSYSLGANRDGRALAAGTFVLLAGGVTATQLSAEPGGLDDLVFVSTIVIGGPIVLGRVVRARGQLNRALREKAAAAERSRDARAAVAVVGERTRIAGELHRHISAALGAMVEQATAAELHARTDPAAAERAFAAIERSGRDALGEIRELLGVLRRDDEELALAPQPSLAHVADLVARVRAAGLPVELEVEGSAQALPAGLDLTAYRVVQQALGGPFEASAGRRATVRLRYGEHDLVLEVIEDGAPVLERSLLGMHERVAMYGGELVAAGHGIRARLPLERTA
jgi:signal transduction histidine kinase